MFLVAMSQYRCFRIPNEYDAAQGCTRTALQTGLPQLPLRGARTRAPTATRRLRDLEGSHFEANNLYTLSSTTKTGTATTG